MAPLTSAPMSKDYVMSRSLRATAFSLVLAVVLLGLALTLAAFLWNNWVRHVGFINQFLGTNAYAVPWYLGIPFVVLMALIFAKYFLDDAKLKEEQRVRAAADGRHMEPTTHADEAAGRRFDSNPTAAEPTVRTGPTGPSGYGAPSGGWDKAKLP